MAQGDSNMINFLKSAAAQAALGLGLIAGKKFAAGQTTLTSAATTVVTGLAAVEKVIASLESDPILTCNEVSATIGDQAGAPAAGSVILKGWQPTAAGDATPIAATGFAGIKVNWIAVGT